MVVNSLSSVRVTPARDCCWAQRSDSSHTWSFHGTPWSRGGQKKHVLKEEQFWRKKILLLASVWYPGLVAPWWRPGSRVQRCSSWPLAVPSSGPCRAALCPPLAEPRAPRKGWGVGRERDRSQPPPPPPPQPRSPPETGRPLWLAAAESAAFSARSWQDKWEEGDKGGRKHENTNPCAKLPHMNPFPEPFALRSDYIICHPDCGMWSVESTLCSHAHTANRWRGVRSSWRSQTDGLPLQCTSKGTNLSLYVGSGQEWRSGDTV